MRCTHRPPQGSHDPEDINALVAELAALRLPELKARYEEALGKPTRCPNRTYLVRSICSAVQEQAADAAQESTETVTEANDEDAIDFVG